VPQAEEFLDAHMLTKTTKADKKAKKKEAKAQATPALGTDTFLMLPQPLAAATTEGSVAPRAGFRRISSVDPAANGDAGDGERTKVAFGLSTGKRKAEDDANGTPPPKRR
jgi:hypothetical protein